MYTNTATNTMFNIIEYLSYLNIWLLSAVCVLFFLFAFIYTTTQYMSSTTVDSALIEGSLSTLIIVLLVIAISPSFLVTLDATVLDSAPSNLSFYITGAQWLWLIQGMGNNGMFGSTVLDHVAKVSSNLIGLPYECKWETINNEDFTRVFLFPKYGIIYLPRDDTMWYESLLDGSWSEVWREYPKPGLENPWFTYPYNNDQYMNAMTNNITMPLYSLVKLYFASFDVIHSFGVAALGIKMDVIPSSLNAISLIPQRMGEFNGFCYELCGEAHSNMLLNVLVLFPYNFTSTISFTLRKYKLDIWIVFIFLLSLIIFTLMVTVFGFNWWYAYAVLLGLQLGTLIDFYNYSYPSANIIILFLVININIIFPYYSWIASFLVSQSLINNVAVLMGVLMGVFINYSCTHKFLLKYMKFYMGFVLVLWIISYTDRKSVV